MKQAIITKAEYQKLIRQQKDLAYKFEELLAKLKIFSFAQEFERLSQWGRAFARRQGIQKQDVLKND